MAETKINPALYGGMEYRCIGPHRGGRVVAVAGDPVDKQTFLLRLDRRWRLEDEGWR